MELSTLLSAGTIFLLGFVLGLLVRRPLQHDDKEKNAQTRYVSKTQTFYTDFDNITSEGNFSIVQESACRDIREKAGSYISRYEGNKDYGTLDEPLKKRGMIVKKTKELVSKHNLPEELTSLVEESTLEVLKNYMFHFNRYEQFTTYMERINAA